MKKFIAIIITIAILTVVLTGCGNESWGMGSFTFEKIHVDTYHYSGCFDVVKWRDSSTGIEVLTEEAGWMFFSEGTYILIEGDQGCPFCGGK